MTTTPRGANELVASQAVPESTVNQQIRHTEAGACHFPVADRDLTAPPGSCADGANYIVATSPTGAWTGKAGQIATALGTNASGGWSYHVPVEGFTAYVQDENLKLLHDGSAWATDSGASYSDEQARDAIGAALVSADGSVTITPNDGADTIDLKVTGYSFGLSIAATPTASEVLLLHIAAEAFTIPANFATPTSKGAIGTNPTASFAIDVQRQVNATGAFSTIGTITISTSGAFTFATVSGTAKAIAVNDVLKFVAPSSADATAANIAITIRGTR